MTVLIISRMIASIRADKTASVIGSSFELGHWQAPCVVTNKGELSPCGTMFRMVRVVGLCAEAQQPEISIKSIEF